MYPGMSLPYSGNSNVFDTSARSYGQGVNLTSAAANPLALGATMNQFANPYTQMVINSALQRSGQLEARDLSGIRAQALQSNAYGGARQGLVESNLMDKYTQNNQAMLANLLQGGYNTTADLALQRLGQEGQLGGQLISAAPTGFNMGQQVNAGQASAGGQQQSLLQQILSQADQQTQSYINAPQQSLGTAMSAISGNPLAGQTTTSKSYTPGVFDYVSLAAKTAAGGKGH